MRLGNRRTTTGDANRDVIPSYGAATPDTYETLENDKHNNRTNVGSGKEYPDVLPPSESDVLLTLNSIPVISDNVRRGRFILLWSTVGYSAMSILERLAQTRYGLQTVHALTIRGFVQTILAIIALPLMTDVSSQIGLPARTKWILAIRGIIGAIAVALHIASLNYIPAGDAIAIYFTSPIFTMIFARIFLKERITRVHVIAAVLSLTGGYIVTSPTSDGAFHSIPVWHRLIGSACSLSAAILSSFVYIILRNLGDAIHFMSSVLSLGVCVTIFSIVSGGMFNPFTLRRDEIAGVLVMFLAAFFAFTGQMGFNRGVQLCPAGQGAFIRNIDVPVVYLLGVVFLHEVPTFVRALGSMLVVVASLIITFQKGD